jgi:hypothetical protein
MAQPGFANEADSEAKVDLRKMGRKEDNNNDLVKKMVVCNGL